jgi:RHS repeat-associated protein
LPTKRLLDDYYPFGLAFNSYKSGLENKYKFQGQEHVDDLDLNWDSFKWRNHQPDLGRFFNVDPLAEEFPYNSVYAFSENKLGLGTELEGKELLPFPWLGTAAAFSRSTPIVRPVTETIVKTQVGRPKYNPAETMGENLTRMARQGREAHLERQAEWEAEGFQTERPFGNGNRADGIKIERGENGIGKIRELKPNSPGGKANGYRQLKRYVSEAMKRFPDVKEWQPELELYYSFGSFTASDATKKDSHRVLTDDELKANKAKTEENKKLNEYYKAMDKCAEDPNCN